MHSCEKYSEFEIEEGSFILFVVCDYQLARHNLRVSCELCQNSDTMN